MIEMWISDNVPKRQALEQEEGATATQTQIQHDAELAKWKSVEMFKVRLSCKLCAI